ncbi:MAG: 2-hydroxyacid dehydrogenase [Flavobacteriales bacterium]|nr:2-hydroxyacid dehydrogenase [Flavobacteriales bacterium]
MSKNKIIFIDSVHPILRERLTEKGFKCLDYTTNTRKEVLSVISSFTGAVIRSKFKIDKEILDRAINLKFIARSGAGLENIDLDYAQQKGVTVYNSPEGNRTAVGEHALGMLLNLFNNLSRADLEVRMGIWDREGNRGHELAGRTVGIIGYGNMGSAFAQRLQGFECNVIAYDKYKSGFGNDYVQEVSIETIFEEADVVSLHTPLTDETRYLINDEFIRSFTKNIYIINTARGLTLNTVDLVNGLKSGKVIGACLDVLEYEKTSFENLNKDSLPEAFQFLTESDQVILSPHIAGWTHESYVKLSSFLADKIEKDLSDYTQ